jgi:TRAP-type C4-dicarboxylate transport system permease small subunit
MKMNNKNWEWYAWLGWGPLVTFALLFVIMFFRGSRLHGTIINCILIGALVSIGMLIYSSYRTYDAVGPKASETDRIKSKSTFLTSVISGALAAVSMIIQWLESM